MMNSKDSQKNNSTMISTRDIWINAEIIIDQHDISRGDFLELLKENTFVFGHIETQHNRYEQYKEDDNICWSLLFGDMYIEEKSYHKYCKEKNFNPIKDSSLEKKIKRLEAEIVKRDKIIKKLKSKSSIEKTPESHTPTNKTEKEMQYFEDVKTIISGALKLIKHWEELKMKKDHQSKLKVINGLKKKEIIEYSEIEKPRKMYRAVKTALDSMGLIKAHKRGTSSQTLETD
ncbi:hypothetical protein [Maridesulfovibrio sp.]|uniref:hypothetical protein n=1 Tax=Maridesulfovibrio sp. TaxID=2795000 RepID=UPI003BAA71C5